MKTMIEMALEAGFKEHNGMIYVTTINDDCARELKAFAELVRADAIASEREACAKVCEENERNGAWITKEEAAKAIRARGQA